MFKISEDKLNDIIHKIVKIIGKLKTFAQHLPKVDQSQLQRIEKSLLSLREDILISAKNGSKEIKLFDDLIEKLLKRAKKKNDGANILLIEQLKKRFDCLKWRI